MPWIVALAVILEGGVRRHSWAYFLVVIALGALVWSAARQERTAAWLGRLPLPPVPRAIVWGYAVVIAEECLVGLTAALAEGFSPGLWAARAGQLVMLTLLAFLGPILVLALAARHLRLGRWDLPVIGGGRGAVFGGRARTRGRRTAWPSDPAPADGGGLCRDPGHRPAYNDATGGGAAPPAAA